MSTLRSAIPSLTANKMADMLLVLLLSVALALLVISFFMTDRGANDTVDAGRLAQLRSNLEPLPERLGALSAETPSSAELAALQQQAEQLRQQLDEVLAQRDTRSGVFGLLVDSRAFYVIAGLSILLLLTLLIRQRFLVRQRLKDSQHQMQESTVQNQRNQEAILRLLDEMGDLAEGDLTVQVSVTEDITGAIADSINYAIEALRELVYTINKTSVRIAEAAHETRQVTERLAKASENQARQIDASSKTVSQMAHSMDDVSEKMAASAEVAEKSVGIAHEGAQRVRRTIQGMDAIREHIQETSKRIKRLGESSQEIGDIVALINDIADQTNILALNAAIQASAAGEAGRGFAVVADEVQRLAERSSNATRRIETLVKTIQADTNEAIISMDKSTTEVVNGAGLAEKAGEALEEIESVSARLAQLISSISRAANQVTEMTSRISTTMTTINELTAQNSEGTVTTASYVAKLDQLAQDLRQSVSGFRLPESA